MANVKTAYGSSGQAVTITLTSLANSASAGRESTAIDNSSPLYLDVLVTAKFTTSTGTIAAPSCVYVYAFASVDGGSEWPDNITGTDNNRTPISLNNLKLLGIVYFTAQSQTMKAGPWSLASLYGGRMPERWGVFVLNNTGIGLTVTAGDHGIEYQGLTATVI